MSTSATEDQITRARSLGLPTPNSGNEDNPPLPTGLDSQRQSVLFKNYPIRGSRAEYFTGPTSSEEYGWRTVPMLLRRVADWMDSVDLQDPEFDSLTAGASFIAESPDDDFYQTITVYYRESDNERLTSKAAISAARKLRINELDRLQKEVNALDERYDAIEDEEMALEKRRINDPD